MDFKAIKVDQYLALKALEIFDLSSIAYLPCGISAVHLVEP